MGDLRHQKYKSKQLQARTLKLENDFKLIEIFIYDMDIFEKK